MKKHNKGVISFFLNVELMDDNGCRAVKILQGMDHPLTDQAGSYVNCTKYVMG